MPKIISENRQTIIWEEKIILTQDEIIEIFIQPNLKKVFPRLEKFTNEEITIDITIYNHEAELDIHAYTEKTTKPQDSSPCP